MGGNTLQAFVYLRIKEAAYACHRRFFNHTTGMQNWHRGSGRPLQNLMSSPAAKLQPKGLWWEAEIRRLAWTTSGEPRNRLPKTGLNILRRINSNVSP
jgi:hypothetical protein